MATSSSDVDETLRTWIADNPSVIGYVVMNSDGIPVKYHEKLPYAKAVQIAALLSDLSLRCKKCLRDLLPTDNDLSSIRLRTADSTEIIVVPANDYVLLILQHCSRLPTNRRSKTDQQTDTAAT